MGSRSSGRGPTKPKTLNPGEKHSNNHTTHTSVKLCKLAFPNFPVINKSSIPISWISSESKIIRRYFWSCDCIFFEAVVVEILCCTNCYPDFGEQWYKLKKCFWIIYFCTENRKTKVETRGYSVRILFKQWILGNEHTNHKCLWMERMVARSQHRIPRHER